MASSSSDDRDNGRRSSGDCSPGYCRHWNRIPTISLEEMSSSPVVQSCGYRFRLQRYESVEEEPSELWLNRPFLPLTEADHCRFKVRSAAARFKAEHVVDALMEGMRMNDLLKKRVVEKLLIATASEERDNDRHNVGQLQEHFDALMTDLNKRKGDSEKLEYLQGLNSIMGEANKTAYKIEHLRRKKNDLTNRSKIIHQLRLAAREEADCLESRVAQLKRIQKKLVEESRRSPVAKFSMLLVGVLFLLVLLLPRK